MKWRYSIALFFAIVFLLVALSFGYRKEYEYVEEQARLTEETESVTVQGKAAKEQVFWVKSLNGYVVVYKEDKKIIYEYTDIRVADLPKAVQEEIVRGKKITGIEKLYGFLENYSS